MNQYFDEVITLLTMMGEKSISKKVDKATMLKEAASFIRLYFDLASVITPSSTIHSSAVTAECTRPTASKEEALKTPSLECLQHGDVLHFFLNAMDAFLMIVSDSGRIFYCTELVTSLLGHMQARLVGQNIFDYVLEQEVPRMKDLFVPRGHPCEDPPNSPIVCYPCREFQCNLKMYNGESGLFPQHLLFQCLSYLRVWKKDILPDLPCSPNESDMPVPRDSNIQSCILLVAKLPTSPSVVDLPISTNEVNFQFDMRISREGKIIDIERQATLVLGYLPGELVGSSFFDYVDPYQLTHLAESIVVIFKKGLGTTTPSRIRSKSGRYVWVISKGYLSYNPWNHKPDHILLSTRVLGCDQVLSEHKFYRDPKLFPDLLHIEEWYNPAPLPQSKTNSVSSLVPPHHPHPPPPHQPHPPPPHQPHPSPPHQLHPPPQEEEPLYSAGMSTCDEVSIMKESLKDVRRELNLKNQELFNLQCRFLEQQQLMEKERNQFYQITRQVMQCMTYPHSITSPNGQMDMQAPLDVMSFEPSTKMNTMQGYNQEFNYMDSGASSGSHHHQFMESSQLNLPEAMLSLQQNNQQTAFPTLGAVLELPSPSPSMQMPSPSPSMQMPSPSPSMQMPLQTSQNTSYLGSTSHKKLHTPSDTNSPYTSIPYLPPSASKSYLPPPSQK